MRSRILEFEAEFSYFVMPGLDGWSSVQTPALSANPAFPLRRKTLYGAARFAVSEGV
jgi:hypothetical protein